MIARAWRIALVALGLASCRDDDVARPPPAPTPPESRRPGPAPEGPRKVEILVGGCRDACADPGTAAARFLEATARDPAAVASFLDSTRLVLDGEPLGERWARAYAEGRTATRAAEIAAAATDLARWTGGLSPDQVRAALASGPRPAQVWSTVATYELPATSGRPWTVTFRPRGVEWLVVEVKRQSL